MAHELSAKIARLARDLGWNQQTFARRANLNRVTVAHIFAGTRRRLHDATVKAVAGALGVTPHDLRTLPVERLLVMVGPPPSAADQRRKLFEQAVQPEVRLWMEQHPDRAAELTPDELDELMSLHGVGGPLTPFGVAESIRRIERRRELVRKVIAIAGTEYADLLESFVDLIFEKVQPYRDRT